MLAKGQTAAAFVMDVDLSLLLDEAKLVLEGCCEAIEEVHKVMVEAC